MTEIVKTISDIENVSLNKIIGEPTVLTNTVIEFKGKDNILFIDKNVRLHNSIFRFNGNNSIIFLSENKHVYYLNATVNNNNTLFFGKHNYINGRLNIIVSEQSNVIFGEDGLISFDIWLRTADPHLIYDADTYERINLSKSIFIGDHVWIGQHAFILKGSYVGSGSVIAAMSLVSGKKIESNCIYGGNPVKKLKDNIFYSNECVHLYLDEQTNKSLTKKTDQYKYQAPDNNISKLNNIDTTLKTLTNATDKLKYLQENLYKVSDKNRFAIAKINNKKNQSFLSKLLNKLK